MAPNRLLDLYGQGYNAMMSDAEDATTADVVNAMLRNKAYEQSPFGRINAILTRAQDAIPEAPEGLPAVGQNVARVGNFLADMLSEGAQTANRWLGAPQFPERVQQGDTLAPLGLAAMGAPFAVRGAIGSAGGRLGEGIRAYHGSPHDFDRFDMSKIGTGEGAQAYGHGLYFAEAEDVAKNYRESLSGLGKIRFPDGREFSSTPFSVEEGAIEVLRKSGGDFDGAVRLAEQSIESGRKIGDGEYIRHNQNIIDLLNEMKAQGAEIAPSGRMYEVNIRANPDELLDWERPLKEQPALQAVIDEHFGPNAFVDTATGEDAMRLMQAALGNDRASEILREAGIPGIRYLDQGSRAAGEGTRNYVLFRDDIIEIVKKYGMAAAVSTYGLEAVQGALAEQNGAE